MKVIDLKGKKGVKFYAALPPKIAAALSHTQARQYRGVFVVRNPKRVITEVYGMDGMIPHREMELFPIDLMK